MTGAILRFLRMKVNIRKRSFGLVSLNSLLLSRMINRGGEFAMVAGHCPERPGEPISRNCVDSNSSLPIGPRSSTLISSMRNGRTSD